MIYGVCLSVKNFQHHCDHLLLLLMMMIQQEPMGFYSMLRKVSGDLMGL
jgi:hypothetical protein